MVFVNSKKQGYKMKLPNFIYNKTSHFFNDLCKPEIIFIIALCCFPIFMLLPSLKIIWICTFCFFILTLLKRGKVLILPSILITIGIVFFALLSPAGKVILTIKSFNITQEALYGGLHRAGILVGMVFLSQFSVSPKLHFPGKIGFFLSQMFTYFDALTAQRISLKPGTIIDSIDEKLLKIWNDTAENQEI